MPDRYYMGETVEEKEENRYSQWLSDTMAEYGIWMTPKIQEIIDNAPSGLSREYVREVILEVFESVE